MKPCGTKERVLRREAYFQSGDEGNQHIYILSPQAQGEISILDIHYRSVASAMTRPPDQAVRPVRPGAMCVDRAWRRAASKMEVHVNG